MRFNKKELLEDLKACLPGIDTGSAMLDGADNFIFHEGKVSSYNGTIAVTVPLRNIDNVSEDLEGAVRANDFYKLVSKLTHDEFELDASDDTKWKLTCGRMKAEVVLKDVDYKVTISALVFNDEWIEVPYDFQKGMKECKMSRNKTSLSGLYFTGNNVISTDSFQINQYRFADLDMPTFWISDRCADVFLKMHDIRRIQVTDKWVHMCQEDGSIFSVRLLTTNKYPYEKIVGLMNIDFDSVGISGTFPPELFKAVDRAITFGIMTEKGLVVKLSIGKDGINVSSNTSNGSYEETVDWDYPVGDMESIVIYVNSDIINFALNNNCKFYILQFKKRSPNLYFVSDNSAHLFATYTV